MTLRTWNGLASIAAAGFLLSACGGGGGTAPANGGGAADAGAGAGKRSLAVLKSGSGIVRSNPSGIDCGANCSASFDASATVSLTAIADSGWTFVGWSGACGGSATCDVSLTSDATVFATFQTAAPPGSHKLVVSRAGDGTGHVGSSPAGIDCGTACTASYSGSPGVTLTAAAGPGSRFAGWSGACTGSGTCTVTVDRDLAATATFAKTAAPPPGDECAGLAPAAPGAPVVLQVPTEGPASCTPGAADGAGNVAFGWKGNRNTKLTFASSAGSARGSYRGFYTDVIGQADGFEGVDSFDAGGWKLVVFGPDGALRKQAFNSDADIQANGAIQANDPTGGVIVFADSSSPPLLIAFDPAGNVRFRVQVAATLGAAFGVDRLGNSLLVFDAGSSVPGVKPGNAAGQWVDHSGKAGLLFDANVPVGTLRKLYPRVGGGLFLQASSFDGTYIHNQWIAQFDPLALTSTPAPAWLLARPDTKLAMARGGRAYALLPSQSRSSSPDCSQAAEVVAASGTSCGTATFTVAKGACTTLSIDVGYDGTVLQQLPSAMEQQGPPGPGPVTCTMRWWPGLLR